VNDDQLLRYSRQLFLPDIDVAGQEKLLSAQVLIIGLGGLGSPVALYLAAAGVGALIFNDDDIVDITNLQRQVLYTSADIKKSKVIAAKTQCLAINPDIEINTYNKRLSFEELVDVAKTVDIIIDGSDNFETRYRVNQVAVKLEKALMSGAAIGWDGQWALYQGYLADAPCYACVFPSTAPVEELRCSETGVVGPVVGAIGIMQSLAVLQYLLKLSPMSSILHQFDGKQLQWRQTTIQKDSKCLVCGSRYPMDRKR